MSIPWPMATILGDVTLIDSGDAVTTASDTAIAARSIAGRRRVRVPEGERHPAQAQDGRGHHREQWLHVREQAS